MKLKILNTKNAETGSIELPSQFKEAVRQDIVRRAVLAIEANNRQPYGADPQAGQRHSVFISKRRRDYRTSYGIGMARSPRKVMSVSGTRFNWVGARAPNTRGGRQAHPPKADKIWSQKMNIQERRKAIRAAMAASVDPAWVSKRGHKAPKTFPFVIDSDFESITKTKAFVEALETLGLDAELARASETKTVAGRAARRGRRKKTPVGPLIVVSKSCHAQKAARNIPGIDVVTIKSLNAKLLAPGCHVGRLTLYTKDAIETLNKDKLFM